MRYIDPVVQEVRDNGARIAEECGGDVHQMAERFRREQGIHPQRVVNRGLGLRERDRRRSSTGLEGNTGAAPDKA